MNTFTPADQLHRLIKQALDTGQAASLLEAEALFGTYRLALVVGDKAAQEPAHQVALLTAIALACRVFLGGVSVVGELDVPLRVSLPLLGNLRAAVVALGGRPAPSLIGNTPSVFIGEGSAASGPLFSVRAVYDGWRGGVLPAGASFTPSGGPVMPLAPMLAAALSVSEAFWHVQGQVTAGRRSVGLSLWDPVRVADWLTPAADGPALSYLPSDLWLIGLGHLGQAYLWALGLLPYPKPAGLALTLQDVDVITPSTESTSVLSTQAMVGAMKTRVMADWAERRGFKTRIVERLFDSGFQRQSNDPTVALCGLDNALGRRALDQAGFSLVVEAGLGRGPDDFRCISMHTLPASRNAAEIWRGNPASPAAVEQVAYQAMLREGGLDQCGVTLLAGKAVGAPFVGSVAACLVVSEVLRHLHGGCLHEFIDLDLHSLEHRQVVSRGPEFSGFNPGYVLVEAPAP